MESPSFCALYLLPIFAAMKKDITWWCELLEFCSVFDEATWKAVMDKFHEHWLGEGNCIGLYADQYIVANLLDPFTTPDPVACPTNWLVSSKNVLKWFYKNSPDSLVKAEQEFYLLMADKEGTWGKYVKSEVHEMDLSINLNAPAFGYYTDVVVSVHDMTKSQQPDLVWLHHFKDEYPCCTKWHVVFLSCQHNQLT